MVYDFAHSFRKRNLRRRSLSLFKGKLNNPMVYLGLLVGLFIIIPVFSILLIARDLPTPDNITKNARYSSSVLDRNNKVIYQIYDDKNSSDSRRNFS